LPKEAQAGVFLYFNALILFKMRPKLLPLILLPIVFSACKDKDWKSATVINSGNVSSNGCGYLLKMEDLSEQKPINLPTAFTHDGLKVKVKFHTKDSIVYCNTADTSQYVPTVDIDDIKRDL